MYSQGCFLAAATSWCLLRALYGSKRPGVWWTAYALLAAAALHTHNFALFMVAAQFLYVALVLCGLLPSNLTIDRLKALRLAAMAFCLVALVYAPWVPTFLQQADRVHQNFWLPEVSASLLAETFTTWLTGLRGGDPTLFAVVWLAFFLMMIGYTISHRDEFGLYLLLQALLPWVATLLIATLAGRPLLDERYLVFAQIALLTYFAYTCAQFPTPAISFLVALNLLVPIAGGAQELVASIPVGPPSITRAVEFMRKANQPGDVIITPEALDLNIFRYYATQAGWHDCEIRCPRVENCPGHVNHISALSPNDWLWVGRPPKMFVASGR